MEYWRIDTDRGKPKYNRVSVYGGSFYDDSLLRHLPSRTEHCRLAVHHCRNSNAFSVLSALLDLLRCARVPSFSILVQFFYFDCDFSTHDVHQNRLSSFAKKKK
jgi:hypothetical protein